MGKINLYIIYIVIKSHISIRSLDFLFFLIFHQLAVNRQGVPTASCTTNGLVPVWNKFVTPDTRTANSWTLATQVSQLYPLIGYITYTGEISIVVLKGHSRDFDQILFLLFTML